MLATTTLSPVDAAPPVALDSALGRARAAVAWLLEVLGDPGVEVGRDQVVAIERLVHSVSAVKLAAIAVVDSAGPAGAVACSGASGTASWLASATRSRGAEAAGQLRLAQELAQRLPATRAALRAGDVSSEHVRVIVQAMRRLPDTLTIAERDAVERSLLAQARSLDPAALHRAARRALAAIDRPEPEVDADHDRALRSEEEQARARSRLTLHDNGDGTTTGHFTVPTLAASILRKVIQQLTAPRRRNPDPAFGAAGRGAGSPGEAFGLGPEAGVPSAEAPSGEAPSAEAAGPTDWSHLQGLALIELFEHLSADRLNGKVAATIVVTIRHRDLISGIGVGATDTGQEISAGEVRRLACSAGIIPAVLGGDSLPLDLGRQSRLFTEAQRVALATVYDRCAAEGCDRPFAWCDLHHGVAWEKGGATNLRDAVPLCGHHHRRLHHPDFEHTIKADASGRGTVLFARRS